MRRTRIIPFPDASPVTGRFGCTGISAGHCPVFVHGAVQMLGRQAGGAHRHRDGLVVEDDLQRRQVHPTHRATILHDRCANPTHAPSATLHRPREPGFFPDNRMDYRERRRRRHKDEMPPMSGASFVARLFGGEGTVPARTSHQCGRIGTTGSRRAFCPGPAARRLANNPRIPRSKSHATKPPVTIRATTTTSVEYICASLRGDKA